MTALPATTGKKLGLVIDLDVCVGCHACAVNCKEWNSGGHMAPFRDPDGNALMLHRRYATESAA